VVRRLFSGTTHNNKWRKKIKEGFQVHLENVEMVVISIFH